MIEVASEFWYLCLAALLLGNATAAWTWVIGRNPQADLYEPDVDEVEGKRTAEPDRPRLEPNKPVITVAQPLNFAPVPPVTVPVPDATTKPAIAPAVGEPDNLRMIKGIGPKLVTVLTALGVTRFDQIAAWTDDDIAEVDRHLGSFAGRIVQDNWVEQAGYLARGDSAGFAARFGAPGQG